MKDGADNESGTDTSRNDAGATLTLKGQVEIAWMNKSSAETRESMNATSESTNLAAQTNPTISPADALKHFEIRRAMIVHEDGQIYARLNLLAVAAGLLFTLSVLVFTLEKIPHVVRGVRLMLFGVLGELVTYAFHKSLKAAQDEQDKIIYGEIDKNKKHDKLKRSKSAVVEAFPFDKPANVQMFDAALQATGSELESGRSIIKSSYSALEDEGL